MFSAFTPDCGYDNSTIILIGTCIVQIQGVRVNFARTKRLFNISAETIINVRNARVCARCAFSLKIKRIPFSCSLVKWFTFVKRIQSQVKMFLEMCVVLAGFVSTERVVNLLTVM